MHKVLLGLQVHKVLLDLQAHKVLLGLQVHKVLLGLPGSRSALLAEGPALKREARLNITACRVLQLRTTHPPTTRTRSASQAS